LFMTEADSSPPAPPPPPTHFIPSSKSKQHPPAAPSKGEQNNSTSNNSNNSNSNNKSKLRPQKRECRLLKLHEHWSMLLEPTIQLLNSEWPRSETTRKEYLGKSCDILPLHLILVANSASSHNNNNNTDANVDSTKDNSNVNSNNDIARATDNNLPFVLGHSCILKVDEKPNCGLLESVVVLNSEQGLGYGRIIMQLTEEIAVKMGLEALYLSTKDKQGFYSHLGFTNCDPVTCLGASGRLLKQEELGGLLRIFGGKGNQDTEQLTWMMKSLKCG